MAINQAGGPAFPTVARTEARSGYSNSSSTFEVPVPATDGMTLRDYFAAKALSGLVTDHRIMFDEPKALSLARLSYKLADAMLVARAEQN